MRLGWCAPWNACEWYQKTGDLAYGIGARYLVGVVGSRRSREIRADLECLTVGGGRKVDMTCGMGWSFRVGVVGCGLGCLAVSFGFLAVYAG